MKLIKRIKKATPERVKDVVRGARETVQENRERKAREKAEAPEAKSGGKAAKGKHAAQKMTWAQAIGEEGVLDKKTANAMKITAKSIRRVMDRSGWTSYEAFCHMCEIAQETGKTFREIAKDGDWRDYRADRAAMKVGAMPLKAVPAPVLSEEAFSKLFYTSKQRKAMAQIRRGNITAQVLCDWFDIKLPDEIMAMEGDLTPKLAFQLSSAKDGAIFLCAPEKYIKKDSLERAKPAVVVGYPSYKETVEEAGIPFVPCPMVGSYIMDMTEIHRKSKKARVVCITGSVGKTTTTGMITGVVGAAKKMHANTGNQNTTWQVADFTIRLKDDHEVYVQECSGSFPHQMEKTSHIVRPDIFVLTNIGNGHIGRYGGKQERLLFEKTALDRHASEGAVGVVNWDDPLLKTISYDHPVRGFAVEDASADYHAENIVIENGQIRFDVVEKDGTRTPVTLNIVGSHNVYNALAAFAVGVELGIDRAAIAGSLEDFETEGARQNLTVYGGRKMYIDCLSATEESMRSAVQTVSTIDVPEGNRKILVLADVMMLGDESEAVHRRIGTMVAEVGRADEVLFYWDSMRYACEEAKARGVNCRFTDKKEELERWLKEDTKPGDLIAIKAGHATGCLSVVDDLVGTGLFVHDKFTQYEPVVKEGDMSFRCIGDCEGIGYYGAALIKADKSAADVVIPAEADGNPVRFVDMGVFSGAKAERVTIPEGVTGIGSGAFRKCKGLKEVSFPSTLKYIGPHAFAGCESLEEADLSGGCVTIDDAAFEDCLSLKKVILPEGILTVREDAIEEHTDIVYM